MNSLVDKITICMQNKNVNIKDIELFKFGLKSVLNYGLLLIVLLISSIFLTHIPIYTFVFAAAFFYLREFCGGFHLNSKILCFIFSIAILLIVPYFIVNISINHYLIQLLFLISTIAILFLAPIDHVNKRMDNTEKMYFKKKMIIRWSVLMIFIFSILLLKLDFKLLYILEFSFILNFFSLISASIKNRCK